MLFHFRDPYTAYYDTWQEAFFDEDISHVMWTYGQQFQRREVESAAPSVIPYI